MEPLQFFNQLKSGLKNAERDTPKVSLLALGFTKAQMAKMSLKKPRLIWYDAATKTYYDQGDSTKIKKSDWTKTNQLTFKKNNPMNDLVYYIPINNSLVSDSNQVVYKK
jgi:hypothetical protein